MCAFALEQDRSARSTNVADFATYEDYLDNQVNERDMYYLQDEHLARQLVELGYRGSGDTLKREEFEERKREIERLKNPMHKKNNQELCSAGLDLSSTPLLKALAEREESVRNGKLTSIVFIRDRNSKGQEVSGFIDFAERLKTEDWVPYFLGKKRLLPRPSDLSYYNWDTQAATATSTINFQVLADNPGGLTFKVKRDRKVINVDPKAYCGDNSTRVPVKTPHYTQVVIFDHQTRRKS